MLHWILWHSDATYWGRNIMADILQIIYSNVFSWMKITLFWIKSTSKALTFAPDGTIDSKSTLVQVMVPSGKKPLHETMITQTTDAYLRRHAFTTVLIRGKYAVKTSGEPLRTHSINIPWGHRSSILGIQLMLKEKYEQIFPTISSDGDIKTFHKPEQKRGLKQQSY